MTYGESKKQVLALIEEYAPNINNLIWLIKSCLKIRRLLRASFTQRRKKKWISIRLILCQVICIK